MCNDASQIQILTEMEETIKTSFLEQHIYSLLSVNSLFFFSNVKIQ